MKGWRNHVGRAVAYDRESVDTDQLIPARFMSTPRAEGYGNFLLHDLRFARDGTPDANFPLNRHPDVSILVSRRNFGTGSSREAAVYALIDFGIRVVIAPSFGDIFASNAVNNGLLPARVSDENADSLIMALAGNAGNLNVDLVEMTLSLNEHTMPFELDSVWRQKLLNGWDDIDLTLNHKDEISAYRVRLSKSQKWRFPATTG